MDLSLINYKLPHFGRVMGVLYAQSTGHVYKGIQYIYI
jgi:hypothetical protein